MMDARERLERMAKAGLNKDYEKENHQPVLEDLSGEYERLIQAALRELVTTVDEDKGYETHELYTMAIGRAALAIMELKL